MTKEAASGGGLDRVSPVALYEKYQNAAPAITSTTITIPAIFMVASNAAFSVSVMGWSLCVAIGSSIVRKAAVIFEGRPQACLYN